MRGSSATYAPAPAGNAGLAKRTRCGATRGTNIVNRER
jgi:hypothetical protein